MDLLVIYLKNYSEIKSNNKHLKGFEKLFHIKDIYIHYILIITLKVKDIIKISIGVVEKIT